MRAIEEIQECGCGGGCSHCQGMQGYDGDGRPQLPDEAYQILVIPNYISLVGSSVLTPEIAHDLDVVIRDRKLPEGVKVQVEKLLGPVHWITNPEGPHGPYMPLFDLVLQARKPRKHMPVPGDEIIVDELFILNPVSDDPESMPVVDLESIRAVAESIVNGWHEAVSSSIHFMPLEIVVQRLTEVVRNYHFQDKIANLIDKMVWEIGEAVLSPEPSMNGASKDKTWLKPLEHFQPMKSTGGFRSEEFSNVEELFNIWGSRYPEGYVIEPKFNGNRIILHKLGDQTRIYFEDSSIDRSASLPNLRKGLEVIPGDFVIDGEVLLLSPKGDIEPRTKLASLRGKNPDDSRAIVYLFDILYLNGEDLTRKPVSERIEALFKHFADYQNMTPFRMSQVYDYRDPGAVERAIKFPGSEGFMAKAMNSKYKPGLSPDYAKFKTHEDIDVVVLQIQQNRNGTWSYSGGLLLRPEDDAEKFSAVQEQNGRRYIPIGKTLATELKAEIGDVIEVSVSEIYTLTAKDGTIKFAWQEPIVKDFALASDSIQQALAISQLLRESVSLEIPPMKARNSYYVTNVNQDGIANIWAWAEKNLPLIMQPKVDGFRCRLEGDGQIVRLYFGDRKLDRLEEYPQLANPLASVKRRFMVDGEFNMLDANQNLLSKNDFLSLVALGEKKTNLQPIVLVFDCLMLDDEPLYDLPFSERLLKLDSLLHETKIPYVYPLPAYAIQTYSDFIQRLAPSAEFSTSEGIMLKRADSVYAGGQTNMWAKLRKAVEFTALVLSVTKLPNVTTYTYDLAVAHGGWPARDPDPLAGFERFGSLARLGTSLAIKAQFQPGELVKIRAANVYAERANLIGMGLQILGRSLEPLTPIADVLRLNDAVTTSLKIVAQSDKAPPQQESFSVQEQSPETEVHCQNCVYLNQKQLLEAERLYREEEKSFLEKTGPQMDAILGLATTTYPGGTSSPIMLILKALNIGVNFISNILSGSPVTFTLVSQARATLFADWTKWISPMLTRGCFRPVGSLPIKKAWNFWEGWKCYQPDAEKLPDDVVAKLVEIWSSREAEIEEQIAAIRKAIAGVAPMGPGNADMFRGFILSNAAFVVFANLARGIAMWTNFGVRLAMNLIKERGLIFKMPAALRSAIQTGEKIGAVTASLVGIISVEVEARYNQYVDAARKMLERKYRAEIDLLYLGYEIEKVDVLQRKISAEAVSLAEQLLRQALDEIFVKYFDEDFIKWWEKIRAGSMGAGAGVAPMAMLTEHENLESISAPADPGEAQMTLPEPISPTGGEAMPTVGPPSGGQPTCLSPNQLLVREKEIEGGINSEMTQYQAYVKCQYLKGTLNLAGECVPGINSRKMTWAGNAAIDGIFNAETAWMKARAHIYEAELRLGIHGCIQSQADYDARITQFWISLIDNFKKEAPYPSWESFIKTFFQIDLRGFIVNIVFGLLWSKLLHPMGRGMSKRIDAPLQKIRGERRKVFLDKRAAEIMAPMRAAAERVRMREMAERSLRGTRPFQGVQPWGADEMEKYLTQKYSQFTKVDLGDILIDAAIVTAVVTATITEEKVMAALQPQLQAIMAAKEQAITAEVERRVAQRAGLITDAEIERIANEVYAQMESGIDLEIEKLLNDPNILAELNDKFDIEIGLALLAQLELELERKRAGGGGGGRMPALWATFTEAEAGASPNRELPEIVAELKPVKYGECIGGPTQNFLTIVGGGDPKKGKAPDVQLKIEQMGTHMGNWMTQIIARAQSYWFSLLNRNKLVLTKDPMAARKQSYLTAHANEYLGKAIEIISSWRNCYQIGMDRLKLVLQDFFPDPRLYNAMVQMLSEQGAWINRDSYGSAALRTIEEYMLQLMEKLSHEENLPSATLMTHELIDLWRQSYFKSPDGTIGPVEVMVRINSDYEYMIRQAFDTFWSGIEGQYLNATVENVEATQAAIKKAFAAWRAGLEERLSQLKAGSSAPHDLELENLLGEVERVLEVGQFSCMVAFPLFERLIGSSNRVTSFYSQRFNKDIGALRQKLSSTACSALYDWYDISDFARDYQKVINEAIKFINEKLQIDVSQMPDVLRLITQLLEPAMRELLANVGHYSYVLEWRWVDPKPCVTTPVGEVKCGEKTMSASLQALILRYIYMEGRPENIIVKIFGSMKNPDCIFCAKEFAPFKQQVERALVKGTCQEITELRQEVTNRWASYWWEPIRLEATNYLDKQLEEKEKACIEAEFRTKEMQEIEDKLEALSPYGVTNCEEIRRLVVLATDLAAKYPKSAAVAVDIINQVRWKLDICAGRTTGGGGSTSPTLSPVLTESEGQRESVKGADGKGKAELTMQGETSGANRLDYMSQEPDQIPVRGTFWLHVNGIDKENVDLPFYSLLNIKEKISIHGDLRLNWKSDNGDLRIATKTNYLEGASIFIGSQEDFSKLFTQQQFGATLKSAQPRIWSIKSELDMRKFPPGSVGNIRTREKGESWGKMFFASEVLMIPSRVRNEPEKRYYEFYLRFLAPRYSSLSGLWAISEEGAKFASQANPKAKEEGKDSPFMLMRLKTLRPFADRHSSDKAEEVDRMPTWQKPSINQIKELMRGPIEGFISRESNPVPRQTQRQLLSLALNNVYEDNFWGPILYICQEAKGKFEKLINVNLERIKKFYLGPLPPEPKPGEPKPSGKTWWLPPILIPDACGKLESIVNQMSENLVTKQDCKKSRELMKDLDTYFKQIDAEDSCYKAVKRARELIQRAINASCGV